MRPRFETKQLLLAIPGELRRAAIRAALGDSGFAVTAEGNGVEQVLEAVAGRTESDLLIFEHDSSRTDLRCLTQFKRVRAAAGIIVMANSISQGQIIELLDAGVDGFVDRRGSLRALASYVNLVLHGQRAVQPSLIGAPDTSPRQVFSQPRSAPHLSGRERTVAGLLAQGLTDKEIARRLDLVHGTVRNYVRNMQRKLSLVNRTQVAVWALQHGIGGGDYAELASVSARPVHVSHSSSLQTT